MPSKLHGNYTSCETLTLKLFYLFISSWRITQRLFQTERAAATAQEPEYRSQQAFLLIRSCGSPVILSSAAAFKCCWLQADRTSLLCFCWDVA